MTSGFLDGLGQLPVLLCTDSCMWSTEDAAHMGADELLQELQVPKADMQLLILAEGLRIPSILTPNEYWSFRVRCGGTHAWLWWRWVRITGLVVLF